MKKKQPKRRIGEKKFNAKIKKTNSNRQDRTQKYDVYIPRTEHKFVFNSLHRGDRTPIFVKIGRTEQKNIHYIGRTEHKFALKIGRSEQQNTFYIRTEQKAEKKKEGGRERSREEDGAEEKEREREKRKGERGWGREREREGGRGER